MPDRYTITYEISPSAVLDAARLLQATLIGRLRFVLAAVAVAGLGLGLGGDLRLGLPVAAVGLAILGLTWFDLVDRWLVANRARSLMGTTCVYVVDDDGIHYQHSMGTGDLPWSAMTDVLANDKTVVFRRDRVLAAYVPASAFESAAERDAFVAFARTRLGGGRPN